MGDELSRERVAHAGELFSRHLNCAQSVFAGLSASSGLSEEQRLALAIPFGGGVAGQGEICGALTGALLALGEARGQEIAEAEDPQAARQLFYGEIRAFTESFRRRHGAIHCRELTGCAMDTAEGRKSYQERGLHENFCSKLVSFAVDEASRQIEKSQEVKR